MPKYNLSKPVIKRIDNAVAYFISKQNDFRTLAETLCSNLTADDSLRPLIHSMKSRVKDPEHLKDKLKRKADDDLKKGKKITISDKTIFKEVEDLAGVRLLHLHTKQLAGIHPSIMRILDEHKYRIIKKPVAYTWDIENEQFFNSIGLKPVHRHSMYTSVHYIIKANRRTEMRCELQVRTLMEEVWGEVSHIINYPHETKSVACKEQLRVLARIASGCTRLVDSIFVSFTEHNIDKNR
jgi:ppGpp synthetase/RelA/SpoT-type nucleotidyltranferase